MSTYEASETNPITSPSAVEQSAQQQTQDNSILSNEAVPLSNTASANIDTPASTTVYTTETPAVVESSDHHLVSESVPITHTRIPDYDERAKPAPAIGNYDLASILRSGATVSQDTAYLAPRESYGANLTRELERETAVPESTSDVPKEVYASEGIAQTSSNADGSVSKYNSTANEASASSRFDSVPEQPWSVRGPPPAADSSWRSSIAGATGAGASSTGGSGIDASNTRTSDVDASSTGVSGVGASNATTSGLTDSKTDAATTSVSGRGATGNITSDYSAAKSSSDEPQSVSDWAKSTSTEPKNDLTSSTGASGSDATGVAGAAGAAGAAGTGSNVASGATGAGSSATSGVTGSGKNAVSGVTSGAKDTTSSGVSGVSGGAKNATSGVTGGAKNATSGVTGGAKDSVSGAAAAGQSATSGVTGGAKNATSGVTGGAKNAVSSGKQGATSAAEKPKKVGMIKKIKKALNMGSSAK